MHVDAVDRHAALVGQKQTHRKAEQRGFAYARAPRERDAAARVYRKGNAAQHGLAGLVGERNMVKGKGCPAPAARKHGGGVHRAASRTGSSGSSAKASMRAMPRNALLDALQLHAEAFERRKQAAEQFDCGGRRADRQPGQRTGPASSTTAQIAAKRASL